MDVDSVELSSQDRAASSESSANTRPFEGEELSPRKRQRLSSSASSPCQSVNVLSSPTSHLPISSDTTTRDMDSDQPTVPCTPTQEEAASEPGSSRITLNLKYRAMSEERLQSPESPTIAPSIPESTTNPTPSKSPSEGVTHRAAVKILSSSSSSPESPLIEIITVVDDSDYEDEPEVAIIGDELSPVADHLEYFPGMDRSTNHVVAVQSLTLQLQNETMADDDCFYKLQDWISRYLEYTSERPSTWIIQYLANQDFWDALPDLVIGLNNRTQHFGDWLRKDMSGRKSVSQFFEQWARLVARFVAMDARALRQANQVDAAASKPSLASRNYLHTFSHLVSRESQYHVGYQLNRHYTWDWTTEASTMMFVFQHGGGSIANLVALARAHLATVPRSAKSAEYLADLSRIVYRACQEAVHNLKNQDQGNRQQQDFYLEVAIDTYQYFKVMDPGLNQIIDKQITILTVENAVTQLTTLKMILDTYQQFASDMDHEIALKSYQRRADFSPQQACLAVAYEWKFRTWRKLLVSSQMQLRVLAVSRMCEELVTIFSHHKKKGEDGGPTTSPLHIHIADLILEMKLVDYIVGIGSHPEIIGESGNIVGFLVASRTYTNSQTDMIWDTIKSSQDPRVVEATLRMFAVVVNLLQYHELLYVCTKLQDLPLSSFNAPMQEHCDNLFRCLVNSLPRNGISQVLEAPPYELLVRLIRESSISRLDDPAGVVGVQHFAMNKLNELMVHGPSLECRRDIYASCIADIAVKSPTASGSICALHALLRPNVAIDAHWLTFANNLTMLIVEELEETSANEKMDVAISSANSPVRQARRDLLQSIIVHQPTSLSPELGQRLWNVLVGSQARSDHDRETAWQMLNTVAKKIGSRNTFITRCFRDYLPELDKMFYSAGALEFAREAVLDSDSDFSRNSIDTSPITYTAATEQIWRMVLTAPENTIEIVSIQVLVSLYLEQPPGIHDSEEQKHKLHLELVKRCLTQLSAAAKKIKSTVADSDGTLHGEDEAMLVVTSNEGALEEELSFTRSLLLLRDFLQVYHSKQRNPALSRFPPIITASTELRGQVVDVQYQTFDGQIHSDMLLVEIGLNNTFASFHAIIAQKSGFKRFRVFHSGREILPSGSFLSSSVEQLDLDKSLILVLRSENELEDHNASSHLLALDTEIVAHFDELWDYLGMDDRLAGEIYHFLIKFPIYREVTNAFEKNPVFTRDVFVLGQPYKCLYAVHALREHLFIGLHDGSATEATLIAAVTLLVSVVKDVDLINSCLNPDLRATLLQHLSDCLNQLLRNHTLSIDLSSSLDPSLLSRVKELLTTMQKERAIANSIQLISSMFELMLEASVQSQPFWDALIEDPSIPQLISDLILADARPDLRKAITKTISQKCSFESGLSSTSSNTFTHWFWTILSKLVLTTSFHATKCEETLTLSLHIFHNMATSEDGLTQQELLKLLYQWGGMLVNLRIHEEVGLPESVDVLARGLAGLVYWCTTFVGQSALSTTSTYIATGLLSNHLFPEVLDAESRGSEAEMVPVLHSATRKLMYDTILILTRCDKILYKNIMDKLAYLVPYDTMSRDFPYIYNDLPWHFERSRAIRSGTGYVGLRNLSNTCYLNSLMTQLFMNVGFRTFMLNEHLLDADISQKLLGETQNLFSHMQNSLKRFVDPTEFASSIRTYEDTNIDVSIQMDVDEFYNLLFDRWEGQILSPEHKMAFRTIYGGQLVQQVKSQECPHISERLEPFSAIQCDIKGKSSLQESLQAYVDGEVMEGDNKYKCSTCDKHVNAVKRACLKDVPDNLIFHLKRFDFNLRTLQRSKINDHFSFPHKIDMRPYKVEYLMETGEEISQDVFELVGILVHSGTAESGHYYSYIRERPSSTGAWVEFNDDSVSPFDPSFIESNCFGGVDGRGSDNNAFQFDKSWSAYMLFYERSSVLKKNQLELVRSKHPSPTHVDIPDQFEGFIAQENEMLMRRYCLYDDSHAAFILGMHENLNILNGGGECSEDHELEKLAMSITMSHLDQVVAKKKDIPDFAAYMTSMSTRSDKCAECSVDLLEWLATHSEALKLLLFRNPDSSVRGAIAKAILGNLVKVKSGANYAYGDSITHREGDPKVLCQMVETLNHLWSTFHQYTKAWPEYFSLLASIVRLGSAEAGLMLDANFLIKILDCIRADHHLNPSGQYARMLQVIAKRSGLAKAVSFESPIELLETLLSVCDFRREECLVDKTRRVADGGKYTLNQSEHHLLIQTWSKSNVNITIEKLLMHNQNEEATQAILAMLLKDLPEAYRGIYHAIDSGLRRGCSCRPYLRAALTLCKKTMSDTDLCNIIQLIANIAGSLESNDGIEYLAFFRDLYEISSCRCGLPALQLKIYAMRLSNVWVPSLLVNHESTVRSDTEEYLQQIFFKHHHSVEEEVSEEQQLYQTEAIRAIKLLGIKCLAHLHEHYISQRLQTTKAALVPIQAVINLCKPYYNGDSEGYDQQFRDLNTTVVRGLRNLIVEELDEDGSDFDNSDDGYSSDVMESMDVHDGDLNV